MLSLCRRQSNSFSFSIRYCSNCVAALCLLSTKLLVLIPFLCQWWEQKVSQGSIEATLVGLDEKRALAQATGLELRVLENWLGNTRKKARKQVRPQTMQ